jgi:Na+/proline symporter
MLYGYYAHVGFPILERNDRVLPHFIVTAMPHGLIGILLAAILSASMSTTCSDVNALANISVNDFYRRMFRKDAGEKEVLMVSKIMTVAWGIILIFVAYLPKLLPNWKLLDICLGIPSLFYGALLGVFLLGFLTKRARESGVIIGAAIGTIAVFSVALPPMLANWFPEAFKDLFANYPRIAWPWWCPLGTLTTMLFGYLLSLLAPAPKTAEE